MTEFFVRALHLETASKAPSWVADVPGVAHVLDRGCLNLSFPITVITGDNGVGKSTLLEAIARSYGFNTDGGTLGAARAGGPDPLFDMTWVQTVPRAKKGYFLRADTHFLQGIKIGPEGPGHKHLHHMSHGESVLAIVKAFPGEGLYLLDEPESGLSAVRQMALLGILHDLASQGAQIIMVTHSPILLAIPGAHLIEITQEAMIEGIAVEETTAFRAMRDFFADPYGIAEYMLEVTQP